MSALGKCISLLRHPGLQVLHTLDKTPTDYLGTRGSCSSYSARAVTPPVFLTETACPAARVESFSLRPGGRHMSAHSHAWRPAPTLHSRRLAAALQGWHCPHGPCGRGRSSRHRQLLHACAAALATDTATFFSPSKVCSMSSCVIQALPLLLCILHAHVHATPCCYIYSRLACTLRLAVYIIQAHVHAAPCCSVYSMLTCSLRRSTCSCGSCGGGRTATTTWRPSSTCAWTLLESQSCC